MTVSTKALRGLFLILALPLCAHAALSPAGEVAVRGAATALVIDEKCTGPKSPQLAQADNRKAVAILVTGGYDAGDVAQAFAVEAMRAQFIVPARLSSRDCKDAAGVRAKIRSH